ncbi:MAG TPA: hypothetical protein VIH57_26225 [Bacteroidales bacterium]
MKKILSLLTLTIFLAAITYPMVAQDPPKDKQKTETKKDCPQKCNKMCANSDSTKCAKLQKAGCCKDEKKPCSKK